MKKPTKAEQEVVRLRGLLSAKDIQINELVNDNGKLRVSYQVDRDVWKAEKEYLNQRAKGWEDMADIHLKKIMSHVCPTPEVKEVHVKGETLYKENKEAWALAGTFFIALMVSLYYQAFHPHIIEKPYYVTVTKADSSCQVKLDDCQSDWRYQRQHIKVLENWKKRHEIVEGQ